MKPSIKAAQILFVCASNWSGSSWDSHWYSHQPGLTSKKMVGLSHHHKSHLHATTAMPHQPKKSSTACQKSHLHAMTEKKPDQKHIITQKHTIMFCFIIEVCKTSSITQFNISTIPDMLLSTTGSNKSQIDSKSFQTITELRIHYCIPIYFSMEMMAEYCDLDHSYLQYTNY